MYQKRVRQVRQTTSCTKMPIAICIFLLNSRCPSSRSLCAKMASHCQHGKRQCECLYCKGASICQHGKRRTRCGTCLGSSICEHGRILSQCHFCKGSSFCLHAKRKSYCRQCGGSSFCPHGKRKGTKCKECLLAAKQHAAAAEDVVHHDAEGQYAESDVAASSEVRKRRRHNSIDNIFIQITARDQAAVQNMLVQNDNHVVREVVISKGYGDILYALNFKCLKPTTWLNSETIDFYFSIANSDAQFLEYLKIRNNWSKREVLICHSGVMRFIVPRANDRGGNLAAQHEERVKFTLGWSKKEATKMGVDSILALKLWIMPYNIDDLHWVLVVVDIEAKRITLYESYARGDHAAALKKVADFLKIQATRDNCSEVQWKVEVILTGHQEGNATECGVFTIAHAMYIVQGGKALLSQCTLQNILLFRQRIAADILQGHITLPE